MPTNPSEAAELWTDLRSRFSQSRQRIATCRKWLTHQVRPTIPEEWTPPVKMEWMLPSAITTPLATVQVMGRRRPYLHREPIGGSGGQVARRKAEQVELWINACLEELERQGGPLWLPLVGALFNQGECAVLGPYPLPAHWEKFPDFTDKDDKVLPQYERDTSGLDRESAGKGFRLSNRASKRAYEDHVSDYKARRLPLVARIVTAEECLPVFGPNFRLDGLLVLSEYSVDALERKGYRWVGGEGHPDQGQASGSVAPGSVGRVSLLEYWTPGRIEYWVCSPTASGVSTSSNMQPHGIRPSTIASLDKNGVHETWKAGEVESDQYPAVIDLEKEYGISRLPAKYLYGAHWAEEKDPDQRGIPFLWPFLPAYETINNVMTAKGVHMWQQGFGGWFIPIDPRLQGMPGLQEVFSENGRPRRVQITPMVAEYVLGEPRSAIHQGTDKDVNEMVQLSLGSVRESSPSPISFGGAGAESGHDRSLASDMLMAAQNHVVDSARLGLEFMGEMGLESATALARKEKVAIPVYVSVRGQAVTAAGSTRKALELSDVLCEGVFDVRAYYRTMKGENLPWAQVMYEWHKGGAIPLRQFLEEGLGDEQPEDTIIELYAEKLMFETEEGQRQLYEAAAQELGDERLAEAFKLKEEGRLLPDGTPSVALQQPGGPQQAPATGVNTMGNPAQAAVAGIVGGALGTQNIIRDNLAGQKIGSVAG